MTKEKIMEQLARAVTLYDEWYDGIIEGFQKRFDRFCYRVEEFIDRIIKTAVWVIQSLTSGCRKATNRQRDNI